MGTIPSADSLVRIDSYTYCSIVRIALNSSANSKQSGDYIDAFCLADSIKIGQIEKLIYDYFEDPSNTDES